MSEAETIARGLTKAQRETMLGHVVEIPSQEAEALEDLGLKLPSFDVRETITRRVWPITPLGLAVRSILAEPAPGGGS